jgi:hypothetical protein
MMQIIWADTVKSSIFVARMLKTKKKESAREGADSMKIPFDIVAMFDPMHFIQTT